MCVVCRGYKTHEEEREKGYFCTSDRFSADGARTRATRAIRWRVLVVLAAKVETERRRAGRPGDFRTHGKTVCVCGCAQCVGVPCVFRRAGSRWPFHAPPQLKPRDEVKSGNQRHEGLRMTGRKGTVCGLGLLGVTNRGNLLYEVALPPCDRQRRRGGTRCCCRRRGFREDAKRGVKDE